MKTFDISEKIGFIPSFNTTLLCFGNFKSKSVFVNTYKLGTTTLEHYLNDSEYFWYVEITISQNDIKINNQPNHGHLSKHQINHIKKIFTDSSTTFNFIMKEPNELFLSSFLYCLWGSFDHQIHSKYYADNDGFANEISDFFNRGINKSPNLLIGYFNELINKFPKKLFDDEHIRPKYIKYINFLTLCTENHNKTFSNFKLLQINEIDNCIKKEFDYDIKESFHQNKISTKTKDEFYDTVISQIDFKEYSLSSVNDLLISSYYNQEISIYKLLKTLLPTIKFDDSEKTDTEDVSVNNNDKKDS